MDRITIGYNIEIWEEYGEDVMMIDTDIFSGCFNNKSCPGPDKESQRESLSDF